MLIQCKDALRDALLTISDQPIAIDLETTGFNPRSDKIIGVAISTKARNYFIDVNYIDIRQLKCLSHNLKILHNFKFDYRFLAANGVDFSGTPTVDTLVMHHLINENLPHDLGSVVKHILEDDADYKKEFWEKYKDVASAPLEEVAKYAVQDTRFTYQIYEAMRPHLMGKEKLYEHVMRLSHALFETERDGINIDLDYVIRLGEELQTKIQDNASRMRTLCEDYCSMWEMDAWLKEIEKRKSEKGKSNVKRPDFSFDSNKQLGELLYDYMRITEQTNKQKKRTVDDEALSKIEDSHPVISVIREQREATKIYGTYIQGILERQVNGVVYPTFNVCGTVTGRISHKDPNMGNMPRSGGIRGMFIPRQGMKIISADYSQLEIVLAAHFSEDDILLRTVREGKSMHDITASALGCDRQLAKTLNFAVLYGATKWKIMDVFKCNEQEALSIITKFFKRFPGLKRIIAECHNKVENNIPLVNPYGRTRTFEGQWRGTRELERCKRQAFNSLIQGTGGDLTNRAFYLIAKHFKHERIGRALFTVHDEVLVEAYTDKVERAGEIITQCMVGVGEEIDLKVPLSIEISEPLSRWEK